MMSEQVLKQQLPSPPTLEDLTKSTTNEQTSAEPSPTTTSTVEPKLDENTTTVAPKRIRASWTEDKLDLLNKLAIEHNQNWVFITKLMSNVWGYSVEQVRNGWHMHLKKRKLVESEEEEKKPKKKRKRARSTSSAETSLYDVSEESEVLDQITDVNVKSKVSQVICDLKQKIEVADQQLKIYAVKEHALCMDLIKHKEENAVLQEKLAKMEAKYAQLEFELNCNR